MEKTFFLGLNNKFSVNANRWLFLLVGLIFLLNGGLNVYARPFDKVGLILGVVQIAVGLFYLFYARVGFSEKSKFAPKARINDDKIFLKSSFWQKSIVLSWTAITKIQFKPYEFVFNSDNNAVRFNYLADADTSIEIKEHLRAIAERKNIPVTGG